MAEQPSGNRLTTGIEGLDDLLEGGISLVSEDGLIMLIKGPPGAGKTTLALQISLSSIQWNLPGKSCYWTVEQQKRDIIKKAEKLGVKEKDLELSIIGKEEFLSSQPGESTPFRLIRPIVEGCLELRKRLSELQNPKYRLLVLDGLNLLGEKEREIVEIEHLLTLMRTRCRVGIIVFEPSTDRYGSIDYQADLILELRGQEKLEPVRYFLTDLRIPKSRFQKSVLGWHQYKTREKSLQVFPSIHFRLSKHKHVEKCVSDSTHPIAESASTVYRKADFHNKDSSFISFFLSGDSKPYCKKLPSSLERGSCTVLLGPRRSLKTQLTFDFLRAGSIKNPPEPGLLVSLIDNQSTIIKQRSTLCEWCCAKIREGKRKPANCRNKQRQCYKHVYLLHMPPGCITTDEFFQWLEHRLKISERTNSDQVQRFVFWDLAQLEFRFPFLSHDPMFLPGLIDYLKYSPRSSSSDIAGSPRNLTSLLMGPSNNALAMAASAMADNVLFSWSDSADKEDGIAVYVDRIEGHPGEQNLYFANEVKLPTGFFTPGMNFTKVLPKTLKNAIPMISEIQSLRGLRFDHGQSAGRR